MSSRILFVDDEPNVLEAYQRNLRRRFSLDIATSGELGLKLIAERGPYAVVVADMQMPVMNGIEFLTLVRQRSPDSVRVMLTGNADQKTAVQAVNEGNVYQFLNKPCPPETLGVALANALHHYQLVIAERELLENTLNGSVNLLTGILASTDPQSFGHGELLRDYMRAFCSSLNMRNTWDLEMAAMLSRIGFVAVPQKVVEKLRSSVPLSAAEKAVVERVPEVGAKLIANIPRLDPVARIVLYQDKNYDGSGFPRDPVAADSIPIGARILHVLNDIASLEATGLTKANALEILQTRTGCYDPQVLDSTFSCFDIYLTAPTSAQPGSRPVSLDELSIGHVLTANVETNDDLLIARAGTRISGLILEKLRNFHELHGIKLPLHIEAER